MTREGGREREREREPLYLIGELAEQQYVCGVSDTRPGSVEAGIPCDKAQRQNKIQSSKIPKHNNSSLTAATTHQLLPLLN